ncbi:MAG TPA: thioredoxin family protein [Solirubrobacteraceae bacterium]|nr:thioredoxin family protein [Solirubrobacteraceae bacterium]
MLRRPPTPLATLVAVAAAALATAGCGSSSDSSGAAPPPQPEPTAQASDFPRGKGTTLADLQQQGAEGPVLAPSVAELHKGRNRYGFALFDTARKQISGAQVAVYTARMDGTGVRGPFIARSESLAVRPQFESRTTAADPDAAKSVYVADVTFARRGKQAVMALVRLDGRLLHTNAFGAEVGGKGPQPPGVGDKAVKVHTDTLADVGGDASKLSTRTPPAEDLLRTDLADVLGRQPVVITFATPLLCQSRVCGPVVDIVEQVKATAPKGVAFIHQEIYEDNKINRGVRPQVAAWRLRSEPWTFVIDRSGRISERFEGAFSPGELQRAVAKVAR